MKHTPGPWKWEKVQAPHTVTEWSLKGPTVLCRFWYDAPPDADALLISAAPELLGALEAMLVLADLGEVPAKATLLRYLALILKARGL